MLIYTGENVVRKKDIIAILDKETYFPPIEHQQPLQGLKKIDLANVKSVVVTTDNVYYSPFASQTLKKRLYAFMKI